MKWSVNYFGTFGEKCHLLKIGYNESNFMDNGLATSLKLQVDHTSCFWDL